MRIRRPLHLRRVRHRHRDHLRPGVRCLLTLVIYAGPDTCSIGHYLEKKISWWWKLAEFGRPVQQQAAPVALSPPVPAAEPAGRRKSEHARGAEPGQARRRGSIAGAEGPSRMLT